MRQGNRISSPLTSRKGSLARRALFPVKGPYAHFARDGRTITTSHYLPGNGQVWDVGTWPPRERKLPDVGSPFNGGLPSADGRRLLTIHADGQLRDLGPDPCRRFHPPPGNMGKTTAHRGWGCLAPDGSSFASPIGDRKVVWRSMPDGKFLREWTFPGKVHRVLFAPDGRHLVTANTNGTLYVLRLRPREMMP